MNILEKIVKFKTREVELKKQIISEEVLKQSELFERPVISLANSLRHNETGIIAEHKRRSPSKSVINNSLSVIDVAIGYEKAGVAGMSVLTDGQFFGGSTEDLVLARSSTNLPLLRKEFIIDPYQLIEAKAIGADAILLISAILSKNEVSNLSKLAKSIGLDVLIEIHNWDELDACLIDSIDIIGVNNRNLKTFEVDLLTSLDLARQIPDRYVKISESGISNTDAIKKLKAVGYQGFLIGETFMKTENPGLTASNFIKSLKS